MILNKNLSIEHFRYGAVTTQFIPTMLIRNNSSLLNIVLSYSISFALLQLLMFLIIAFVLKDFRTSIIYILTWVILIRSSYFNPCTEVQQGMAFLMLQLSVLQKSLTIQNIRKNYYLIVSGILSYILLNFHVILILPAFFFHGYLLLEDKFKYKREILISTLFLSISTFIKRVLLPVSSYELQKQIPLEKRIELLPDTLNLPSTRYFINFFFDYWLFILPVFLILLIFQFKRKDILLSLYYWGSFFGICLLIFQAHFYGESPMMYENYYIVIGFFIAFGLLHVCGNFFEQKITIAFFVIYLISSSYSIVQARTNYSLRIDYIERLIARGQAMPEKKYILNEENYPAYYAWTSWALPFETALLSSIYNPNNAITVYSTRDLNEAIEHSNSANSFLGPSWAISWFNVSAINNRLFIFPQGGYKNLNDTIHTSNYFEMLKSKITIDGYKKQRAYDGHNVIFDLTFKNSGNDTIFSGKTNSNSINIVVELIPDKDAIPRYFYYNLEQDFIKDLSQTIFIGMNKPDFILYSKNTNAKIFLKLNDKTLSESNIIRL